METTLTAAATVLMWVPGLFELMVVAIIIGIPVAVILLLLFSTGRGDDRGFLTLRTRNDAHVAQDEQILREMNEGLQRMEQRIDALETLLADDKPKGEQK